MQDQNQNPETMPQEHGVPQVVTAQNDQGNSVGSGVPPASGSGFASAPQYARPFPVGKLLLIIFGPGALLVVSLILQIINRFIFTSTAGGADVVHPAQLVINLITMGIGVISVIGIICMPVAVILLIVNYNSKKNR